MQADPNSDRKAVRPGSGANFALDGERRFEAGQRALEDGEHLIRAGLDLAAIGCADRRPKQAPNIREEAVIPVTKASHEAGRALDVGEQKGHDARRQRAYLSSASLDLTAHPLVFEGERHRGRHRSRQVWIVEYGAVVNK